MVQVPFKFSSNGDGMAYPESGGNQESNGVNEPGPETEGSGIRHYVVANDEVKVVAERVQYIDANGKLITESGTPMEIIQSFGGLAQYQEVVCELETALYRG